jgi:hypothetical protein
MVLNGWDAISKLTKLNPRKTEVPLVVVIAVAVAAELTTLATATKLA